MAWLSPWFDGALLSLQLASPRMPGTGLSQSGSSRNAYHQTAFEAVIATLVALWHHYVVATLTLGRWIQKRHLASMVKDLFVNLYNFIHILICDNTIIILIWQAMNITLPSHS